MIHALFPRTPEAEVWQEFQDFDWTEQPEAVWQFSRQRYIWAKDQWPNVSGHVTTLWTLEDLGMLDKVNPELVQRMREARTLPSRLEQQQRLSEDIVADVDAGQAEPSSDNPGSTPKVSP